MIENVMDLVDKRKIDPYMGVRINKKEHRERAERLVKSAKEKKVKIVAAQNTKYWEGQEELIGIIQNIRKIDKQNKVSNSYKNLNQLKELYQGYEEALENTVQIAKKCYTDYVLRGHKDFKDMNAKFPIPKDYQVKEVHLKVIQH